MTENKPKRQLVDFMALVDNEVSSFVEGLTETEKSKIGSLEKWSAKDVFTHLIFWGNYFNTQFTNAKKSEKVPVAGDFQDEVNDGVLYQHLEQPFDDALLEYKTSFNISRKIIADVAQDDLVAKDLFEYLKGRSLLDMALGTFGWHVVFHISDYYLKANQKEKAIELQENYTEELRSFPNWEANAIYNLGCFYAQIGEFKKVISKLKTAFLMRPDLIDWAKKDSDLDPLREDADFRSLFANN